MANEKMNKRSLAAGIAAAALAFGVIGGSLAYLQDSTSTIENEFTYGMVDISIEETAVDEYGAAVSPAATVVDGESQTYKLIPGHSYTKDPVVTVTADSEDSYVFFVVDNEVSAIEDSTAGTIDSQIQTAGWTELTSANTLYIDGVAKTATQKIYYKSTTSSNADQDLATFTTLNIAGNASVSGYDGDSIDVSAYAVQADGFNTALAAWEATFGAHV